jgi:hypothetical protein
MSAVPRERGAITCVMPSTVEAAPWPMGRDAWLGSRYRRCGQLIGHAVRRWGQAPEPAQLPEGGRRHRPDQCWDRRPQDQRLAGWFGSAGASRHRATSVPDGETTHVGNWRANRAPRHVPPTKTVCVRRPRRNAGRRHGDHPLDGCALHRTQGTPPLRSGRCEKANGDRWPTSACLIDARPPRWWSRRTPPQKGGRGLLRAPDRRSPDGAVDLAVASAPVSRQAT